MKVDVKVTGLDGVLDLLKSLPPEVVSKKGGPVLAALRAGAKIIRDEARRNFVRAVAEPGASGITQTTGFTEKRIIYKRRNPILVATGKGEMVVVTVKPDIHPSGNVFTRASRRSWNSNRSVRARKPQSVKANDIAFFMEVGTSKQQATPWLRPAFAAKAQDAIKTIEPVLIRRLDLIIRKLSKSRR